MAKQEKEKQKLEGVECRAGEELQEKNESSVDATQGRREFLIKAGAGLAAVAATAVLPQKVLGSCLTQEEIGIMARKIADRGSSKFVQLTCGGFCPSSYSGYCNNGFCDYNYCPFEYDSGQDRCTDGVFGDNNFCVKAFNCGIDHFPLCSGFHCGDHYCKDGYCGDAGHCTGSNHCASSFNCTSGYDIGPWE